MRWNCPTQWLLANERITNLWFIILTLYQWNWRILSPPCSCPFSTSINRLFIACNGLTNCLKFWFWIGNLQKWTGSSVTSFRISPCIALNLHKCHLVWPLVVLTPSTIWRLAIQRASYLQLKAQQGEIIPQNVSNWNSLHSSTQVRGSHVATFFQSNTWILKFKLVFKNGHRIDVFRWD